LRERLPEKTFKHCLSVAELMGEVAPKSGVDRAKAIEAGLLHDLCKATKPEKLLAKAKKFGLAPNATQKKKPNLLHGAVAAEEARRLFAIDDEVYDAIRWHTTGRPDFGRLGLTLYFCDFSEPLRSFPEAAVARGILDAEGFEPALCFVAERRLIEVRSKPFVDPTTEAFHDWIHGENGCCS
ncbi:MAG: bis(5'-nucleosyl)-tetraphosphatase (symmetrical) YqeK, partial [FCB group bacterium]|jgi:predicted HD superfamily hydrolase involved in NAD metabolism|nr:bis(5'-nucleosyl)-tetraphosphatase (symmetrical) YqeK [FCB group bacterium]